MLRLAARPAPDLSTATAQASFCAYMPGCLASLVIALAFGTTRSFRDRLRSAFVPRCLESSSASHSRSRPGRGRGRGRSRELSRTRYVAMDNDNGILSRQKRLSMEKQLRIEVTYEFEIRNEQAEPAPPVLQLRGRDWEQQPVGEVSGKTKGAASAFPYSVESHQWDDTARILPKKPSISVIRGQG